jgi:hypothetical protein
MAYIVDDFSNELEKLATLIGERLLSDWEEEFIESLVKRSATSPISAKQIDKINDILESADKNGWFSKGWTH